MYIQITTKCNMSCKHCCFSCGAQGVNMDLPTFRKAIDLAVCLGEYISIGGGEPTTHPMFWEFLGRAMGASAQIETGAVPWLATNGKRTKDAITLASLAKQGSISCALSRDEWHDEIDQDVLDAFGWDGRHFIRSKWEPYRDLRQIKSHQGSDIKAAGRAEDWGAPACCCNDLFIGPTGVVYPCGCRTHKIGHLDANLEEGHDIYKLVNKTREEMNELETSCPNEYTVENGEDPWKDLLIDAYPQWVLDNLE